MKLTTIILTSLLASNSLAAPPIDNDGDGIPRFRDCDDTNPRIGLPLRQYWDSDTDGLGDISTVIYYCGIVSGYVRNHLDCDDTDSSIGLPIRQWIDSDVDGFGNRATRVNNCELLSGFVTNYLDCDDTDSSIYPGAEETYDGLDNDCDGNVDDYATLYVTDVDYTFIGESAGDAVSEGRIVDDVDGDGSLDVLLEASGSDLDGTDSGTFYLVTDFSSDTVSLGSAQARIIGSNSANDFESAGDTNNDGYGDLLFGVYTYNAAYLFLGPLTGDISFSSPDAIIDGEYTTGYHAGFSISEGTDFNLDGYDDIIISDECNATTHDGGAAYIVNGPITGNINLSSAEVTVYGENSVNLGWSISSADISGDGFSDLLISSYNAAAHGGLSFTGGAFILHGPSSGTYTTSDSDAIIISENDESGFGSEITTVGDTNNDGYDDVLIGAMCDGIGGSVTGDSMYGSLSLMLGPISGNLTSPSDVDTYFIGYMAYEARDDFFVNSYGDSYGDIDGDNNSDIIIQSSGETSYVMFGPVSTGTIDSSDMDLTIEDYYSVSGGRDFDGDGLDDLLLGDSDSDLGGTGSGAAYLLFGGNFY